MGKWLLSANLGECSFKVLVSSSSAVYLLLHSFTRIISTLVRRQKTKHSYVKYSRSWYVSSFSNYTNHLWRFGLQTKFGPTICYVQFQSERCVQLRTVKYWPIHNNLRQISLATLIGSFKALTPQTGAPFVVLHFKISGPTPASVKETQWICSVFFRTATFISRKRAEFWWITTALLQPHQPTQAFTGTDLWS